MKSQEVTALPRQERSSTISLCASVAACPRAERGSSRTSAMSQRRSQIMIRFCATPCAAGSVHDCGHPVASSSEAPDHAQREVQIVRLARVRLAHFHEICRVQIDPYTLVHCITHADAIQRVFIVILEPRPEFVAEHTA